MGSYRAPDLFPTLFRAMCAQVQLNWNDEDATTDEKIQAACELIAKAIDTSGEHAELKGLPLVEDCLPGGDYYDGFCIGLILGSAVAKHAQLGLTTAAREDYT